MCFFSKKGLWKRRIFLVLGMLLVLGMSAVVWLGLRLSLPNPTPHPWQARALLLEFPFGLVNSIYYMFFGVDSYDVRSSGDSNFHQSHTYAMICRITSETGEFQMKLLRQQKSTILGPGSPEVPKWVRASHLFNCYGHFDESLEILELLLRRFKTEGQHPFAKAPEMLLKQYGLTCLRMADNENGLVERTPDTCLYPLEPAARHRVATHTEKALEVFSYLAQRYPKKLTYRWLASLECMALGKSWPEDLGTEPKPATGFGAFPRFKEVSLDVGLDYSRLAGDAIFEDMDGDGLLDLMLGSQFFCDPLLFFKNLRGERFEERTQLSGLEEIFGAFRLVTADYDNDGDVDVFVNGAGWIGVGRNALLQNDGTGRFTDVTTKAGLDKNNEASMGASWCDYNQDGHVDLFVPALNYGEKSRLFRNLQDGTFLDVTKGIGIPSLHSCSGSTWGDYDRDGHPDLYVSVFGGANYLFRNTGLGTFVDVTFEAGVARPYFSFPVWFFDYDNDGWLDLFAATIWQDPTQEIASLLGQGPDIPVLYPRLYRNRGDGTFEDFTEAAGLGKVISIMGANFGDLDNDGYLDMYFGTGSPPLSHITPNRLFHNIRGQHFEDVTFSAHVGCIQKGHGVALADYDGDGDLDILANMGGNDPGDRYVPLLFQNPGNGNHWLGLKLIGTKSNRSGIGARIEVSLAGGRKIYRTVNSGGTFGNSPLQQHIGIGEAEEVEAVEIRWPSGIIQHLSRPVIDQVSMVREVSQ